MRLTDAFRFVLAFGCSAVLIINGLSLVDANQRVQTQILFDDQVDVFVMNSDGANVRRVIRSPSGKVSRDAAWSADKKSIVFISDRDGPREIYVADADGADIRRLTYAADGSARYSPRWSPDGSHIAYRAGGQIYVMDADGSDSRPLTPRGQIGAWPAWSPDGNKIAFAGGQQGTQNIYVMNSDGSDARPLTRRTSGSVGGVSWSPDGKEILFDAGPGREGPWDIWVIGADGSNERQLTKTNDGKYTSRGTWSPDGKSIAFHSNRDGTRTGLIGSDIIDDFEIYVMDSDGSHVRRLTFNASADTHPDWR